MRLGALLLLLASSARADSPYAGVWQCKFPGGEETLRIWYDGITSVQWPKADRLLSGNVNERKEGLSIAWAEDSKEVGHLSDANTLVIERGKLHETCSRVEKPNPTGYWSCFEPRTNDPGRHLLFAQAADGTLRKYEGEADASIRWDDAKGRGAELTVAGARWSLEVRGAPVSPKLFVSITTSETHTYECRPEHRPHSFPQIPRSH
jgi:hypothetical protein